MRTADGGPPAGGRGFGWRRGWWDGAARIASPNFGARPAGARVDTVVLHSISLPPGEYGGGEIARLFTNTLDWSAHPYFEAIRGLQVSAHFVVPRDGAVQQFVSIDDRAWHAGRSRWDGRDGCNDFSIGIELEGLEGDVFEPVQYDALVRLLSAIDADRDIRQVVGHEHVAPGRKFDPGPGFDWALLASRLRWDAARIPPSGRA
ncbi:MAG: 1,6-anhydro-N-acetylmuramyl-L-alanine amidase AmpD [Burkholderiaceae bacterium]